MNWFGSMVVAGLCAPILVWLTIYCIRTRRVEAKKRAKAAQMAQSTLISNETRLQSCMPASSIRLKEDDGRQKVHCSVPTASIPSRKDESNQKVPKRVNLRRWMGWWTSSSTSREYPPDFRARTNGDYIHTKREHFTRFFGWASCSDDAAQQAASQGVRNTDIRTDTTTKTDDTSIRSPSGEESFQLRVLISNPRDWHFGRHRRTRVSQHNSADAWHPGSGQELSSFPDTVDDRTAANSFHPTPSGTKVQQYDGLSDEDIPDAFQGQRNAIPADLSSSAETSGHWTIRRRTVGIAEVCDWDNLRCELRKSMHSQMLLPDELASESARTTLGDVTQTPLIVPQEAGYLLPSLGRTLKPSSLSPRLRKVCSSPDLRSAFEQAPCGEGNSGYKLSRIPVISHSTSVPLISFSESPLNDPNTGDDPDCVQADAKIEVISSEVLSIEVGKGEDFRTCSLAFSFDKTRRSTLDVIKQAMDSDRRTLEDYEAESTIDGEASNRDSSRMTFSSIESDPVPALKFLQEKTNEASVGSEIFKDSTAQVHNETVNIEEHISYMGLNSGPVADNELPTVLAQVATKLAPQSLGHSESAFDRFATTVVPERRYSFPSIEKGIDLKSELDRRFSFRFGYFKRKEESTGIGTRGQSTSRQRSLNPIKRTSDNQSLVIAKTRGPKSGKSKAKKKAKSRKLTPFRTWNGQLPSDHKNRKTLSEDWRTLSRLSEASSLLSENDAPLKHFPDANLWFDGTSGSAHNGTPHFHEHTQFDAPERSKNLSYRSRMEDNTGKPKPTVCSPRSMTPQPSFVTS